MGKIIIQIHSFVDVITNSSTEIFATVKGQRRAIEGVIAEIMKEMGCEAVEFSVNEYEDWENDKIIPGKFQITYDFEIHHSPCEIMEQKLRKKLAEKFTIIEED